MAALSFGPERERYVGIEGGYTAAELCDLAQVLPDVVLRATRRKRTAWNAVLARNEAGSESYADNLRLFWRTRTGAYLPDPRLALRTGGGETEAWVPVWTHLGLDLLRRYPHGEGAYDPVRILTMRIEAQLTNPDGANADATDPDETNPDEDSGLEA